MPATRTEKDHATKRQELTDVAEALFASQGYEATPVSDIVRAAGVSQGTFYWYFPTKDHVLLGIFEKISAEARACLRHLGDTSLSIMARGDRVLDDLHESYLRHQASWQLFRSRSAHVETLRARQELNREFAHVPLTATLREGIARGELGMETDPETTARLIVTLVEEIYDDDQLANDPAVMPTLKGMIRAILRPTGGHKPLP